MKFSFTTLIIFFLTQAGAQNAANIVLNLQKNMIFPQMQAEIALQVERPGFNKNMEMKVWTKGTDYAMTLITSPEKEKGQVFLKSGSELYNYLPGVNKTIKLPATMLGQSFLGTDISNEAMMQPGELLNNYTASLSGTETAGGLPCWKITLTPKENTAVVWGKMELLIDKKHFMQMKTVFYDEDMDAVSTLTGSKPITVAGRTILSRYEMTPVGKKSQRTVMVYKSINPGVKLDAAFFSRDNMKNVR